MRRFLGGSAADGPSGSSPSASPAPSCSDRPDSPGSGAHRSNSARSTTRPGSPCPCRPPSDSPGWFVPRGSRAPSSNEPSLLSKSPTGSAPASSGRPAFPSLPSRLRGALRAGPSRSRHVGARRSNPHADRTNLKTLHSAPPITPLHVPFAIPPRLPFGPPRFSVRQADDRPSRDDPETSLLPLHPPDAVPTVPQLATALRSPRPPSRSRPAPSTLVCTPAAAHAAACVPPCPAVPPLPPAGREARA